MLARRDEILGTSRASPVVLRALVNAIGDGNNDPLWRSEVDRMDVQGDPSSGTKRRTTRGGYHDRTAAAHQEIRRPLRTAEP
jgi:hypothetical protein